MRVYQFRHSGSFCSSGGVYLELVERPLGQVLCTGGGVYLELVESAPGQRFWGCKFIQIEPIEKRILNGAFEAIFIVLTA